jgi:ABC-type glycerol-3-phosphate transport system substrate-binding protein
VKKFFATLTAAVLAATMLAACTGSPAATTGQTQPPAEQTTQAQQTTTTAAPPTEAPAKDVELSLMSWGPIEQSIIDRFNDENPGITVEFQQIATDYDTILNTRLAAGESADVFGVGTKYFANLVSQGYLYDLTNEPYISSFTEATIANTTLDGKVYCVPMGAFAEAVWYNKDVFDRLSLQIPTDYGQFLKLCEDIKNSGEIAPIVCNVKDGWATFEIGLGAFTKLVADNPNIYNDLSAGAVKYTDPQFVEAFQKFEHIVKQGYVMEGSSGLDWQGAQTAWAQEEAAMYITGSWNCGSIGEAQVPFEIGVFTMPQNDPGGTPAASLINGLFYGLNAKGANVEASRKFLAYFADLEGGASEYFASNGYLPSIKGATVDDPLIELWLPIMAGPGYPSFRDNIPAGVGETLYTALNEVFTGAKTPEQAVQDMQAAQDKVGQ